MRSESALNIGQINENVVRKKWTIWHLGAILSFFIGLGAILIGAMLTLEIWFYKPEVWHFSLQTITNILFYSALPLLFLGAYCLDKLEALRKKENK